MPSPPRAALAVFLAVTLVAVPSVGASGGVAAADGDARPAAAVDGDTTASDRRPVVAPNESNASVAAWRVPASVDAANATATDLETYRDDASGEVVVTPEDRLAVAVSVPGLDARVADRDGPRAEHVLDALDASGHFSVRQTRDTTTPERVSASLWLNASNARAVPAGEDRYVLVVDPGDLLAVRSTEFANASTFAATYAAGNESYRFVAVTERYASEYAFTARYYVNDTDAGLLATSERARFVRATASVDDAVPLEPAANATVTGETTVAPGTELVVTASDGDGVVATDRVVVAADGTYAATLDLADRGPMLVSNVSVAPASNRSRVLADVDRLVLESDADLGFDEQTSSTRYVSVRASLTHGGTLVLRNETGVVDASTYLAPGVEQTVTFTLPDDAANGTYTVVAYRGQPDDTGRQYANGTATARLEFAPDGDGTTTTTSGTTPTSEATTGTTPTTATTRTEPRTTPVAQPGFGAAVALGALATLLGVVLAGRKRGDDR